MAKIELKVKGIEAIQQRLLERKQALEERLEDELRVVAENAVTHAKLHKGYKDRTTNLKNTISYVLYKDGMPVSRHIGHNKPKKGERVVSDAEVQERLQKYASDNKIVNSKGYCLVIVAPMEYAAAVESKGYNVLYLTKFFLQDEIKLLIKDIMNEE